ncbi:hypothetical protein IE00_14875 [Paracoccus sp. SM22M-07]|nr:hypothetical protein IE00_14875 [Paracoccus sp. SM22M-07]
MPGRFTACLDFDVQGPVQSRLTLQLAAQDGGAQPQGRAIDLRVLDAAGTAQRWPAGLPVILQSLRTGWR